ncbi:hypothetical protein ACIBEJ_49860 [Nonomuraea sp. NPDC050790]|uniref:hypothetical protein n=1 Tax=Nonomuraea sp. NPDC050790 TaxID=3364371 RepID=UPI0037BD17F9
MHGGDLPRQRQPQPAAALVPLAPLPPTRSRPAACPRASSPRSTRFLSGTAPASSLAIISSSSMMPASRSAASSERAATPGQSVSSG